MLAFIDINLSWYAEHVALVITENFTTEHVH